MAEQYGIVQFNPETRELKQAHDNLDYGQALRNLSNLRGKKDGSWYWMGHKENHLGLTK